MFGNDLNRYSKDKKNEKEETSAEEQELESYLQARNAAIGEETKTVEESEEEQAMKTYMKLRSKAYGGDEIQIDTYSRKDDEENLDTYLEQRNATFQDKLSKIDTMENELDAYQRKRKEILDE